MQVVVLILVGGALDSLVCHRGHRVLRNIIIMLIYILLWAHCWVQLAMGVRSVLSQFAVG